MQCSSNQGKMWTRQLLSVSCALVRSHKPILPDCSDVCLLRKYVAAVETSALASAKLYANIRGAITTTVLVIRK